MQNELSIPRRLESWLAEYDAKLAAVPEAIAAFERAGDAIKSAACVSGTFGNVSIDTGHVHRKDIEMSLRRSAWLHVWKSLRLPEIASAMDKRRFDQSMSDPPPFDLDNLRATFGPYLKDPRGNILRGLAEVFSDLDPAYKSHEKVKIGVKGLPKRVILSGVGRSYSYGMDKARDIINALAAYQGKPLVTHAEMSALEKDGDALRESRDVLDPFESYHVHKRRELAGEPPKTIKTVGRGIWLKKFANGNGHLFFGPEALRDINKALAEFYGDVLADCPDADEDRPAPRTGTAVAKDLQFYPTPTAIVDRVVGGLYNIGGWRALEPSCGDGRIMDALARAGAVTRGVEVDAKRASLTAMKGHIVHTGNFLDMDPVGSWSDFDLVVMNPPFYGRHYAKHVRHAMKFLKPGGQLLAILPATARYDHGLLDDLKPQWCDLPVGAFAESGTNIATTVATIRAPK